MNILNISTVDFCGIGINLTNAINDYTEHRARNLSQRPHRFNYETDILTTDKGEIRGWLEWADVISSWVTFDATKGVLPEGKILVLHHIGGHYYSGGDLVPLKRNRQGREMGAHQFVAGAYLTRWGLPWLPFSIPVDEYKGHTKPETGGIVVCQTASSPKRQRVEKIKRVLGNRADMELRVISDVPHDVCLARRGEAHIALGCFKGYGFSECEAWSMGQPVISCPQSDEDEEAELKHIGYLPYYKAEIEELPDVLDRFLASKPLRDEWADRGHRFVREFHDAPVVAREFTRFLEGLR